MRDNFQGVKIFQIGYVVNHYNFLKRKICEINHEMAITTIKFSN